MPHSIFFRGGYAIHGTYATRSLGRPASHGCVRISPANAAKLYSLVRAEGATIRISGSPPPSRPFASEWRHRKHHHHYAYNAGRHHRHYAHYTGRPYHSSVMSYAPTRQGTYPAGIFGVVLSQ